MDASLRVEVKDTVLNPSSTVKAVHWRASPDGTPFYKVYIYLTGEALPVVQTVTYRLHPSFPDPVQQVSRTLTNQSCLLVIWTWGIFDVTATIKDHWGNTYEVTHSLGYNREIEQLKADDPKVFQREDETPDAARQPKLMR
jgi:hypothetical protein